MDKRFELENVIGQLRRELQAAEEEGRKEDLRFGVDGVDLEIKVAARASEEAECGFKLYVFSLGGKKKSEDEQAITVKLRLTPRKGKREAGAPVGDFEVSRMMAEPTGRRRHPGKR